MDHVKFAYDLGFLVARAKFAALNPEEEKKKGWWSNLPGYYKGLLLGLGGTGLAAGGMALGGHMLTGDYKAPFVATGNAIRDAADTFKNQARLLIEGVRELNPSQIVARQARRLDPQSNTKRVLEDGTTIDLSGTGLKFRDPER